MRHYRNFKDYHIEQLSDPENAKIYLSVALEDYEKDGDIEAFSLAMRDIAEAQGGMAQFAERISLTGEESYPSKTYSHSSGRLAMFDTLTELTKKISLGEDSTIELKRELPRREDLADEIAAFANANGGAILIGVEDNGDIVGMDLQDLAKYEKIVIEICRDSIEPTVHIVTEKLRIDDKNLLKIEVPRSLFVHQSSGRYFIREGSSKRRMPTEQLARLLQSRSQARIISFDEQFVPNTYQDTLRETLYQRFITEGVTEREQIEDLLLKRRLLVKEGQEIRASVAGVLMCHDTPDDYLYNSFIQAVFYNGEGKDANYQIDAKDFKGPLDEQIVDAFKFVQRYNQVSARKKIGRVDQPQYSMRAVFEAVVNAVVHRDYSKAGSKIRLFMFADRMELYSPGALANTLTVDDLLYNQATRNELLARLLSEIALDDDMGKKVVRQHFLERRGEGVGIILNESETLSGKTPVYELFGEELRLTIFAAKSLQDEAQMQSQCIYCKTAGQSEEHAFPKSLLHECVPLGKRAPEWIITQLCKDCNNALGKLDNILATRSSMAAIWRRIKNEWEPGIESQDSSFYNAKAYGIDPVLLFYPDPLYENFMVLHEETGTITSGFYPTPVVRALAPQIILTLYTEGQTVEQVIAQNYEKWETNELRITESDEHRGVYCISGNTYVFPPKATRYFVSNPDKEQEFKAKFLKKRDNIRYDLYFLSSNDREDAGKLKAFYERLASTGTQEQTEVEHFDPKEFPQKIMAVANPKARPYIDRATAKTVFHCFLYHYRQFSGHEPIFNDIKAFIEGKADSNGETGKEFVAGVEVTEDYIRDSNEHFHILRFYVNGDNIVCHIAFFTGLLVGPFASGVTLAGDYDKAMRGSCQEVFIPFYVHAKSELKRRMVSVES